MTSSPSDESTPASSGSTPPESADSTESAPAAASTGHKRGGFGVRLRRRAGRVGALVLALGIVGAGYSLAAPSSSADDGQQAQEQKAEDIAAGQQLYNNSCITCHGANLQGVADRGPSLIGVGEAAVYFQVATGRMPIARQEAQALRKPPMFDEKETEQLAAYIQDQAGGPTLPDVTDADLADADLAYGGEMFRLNCASCHNFAGEGGALSSGKHAPPLSEATPKEIYAAMLSGPQNMPTFGDNQLTPEDKHAIIAYVETLEKTQDPGGASIGRTGPVPEGLVLWLAGIGALLLVTVWVAGKS